MASRKTRTEFRITKRNYRGLGDMVQELHYWRDALNNVLYPLLEERLEMADERECEYIQDLLEMADGGCTEP